MHPRTVIALLCFTLLPLAGCGKKGALIPPEARVPAPVFDLRLEQKGEQFLISWSAPTREEGGGALRGLGGFRVVRREVLAEGEECAQCSDTWRIVRNVDLEYLKDVSRQGGRYFFSDGDLVTGRTYQYKVLSLSRDGATSRDSNKEQHRKHLPPPAPVLVAEPTPGAVELSWQAEPVAAWMHLLGYNVYRRSPGAPFPPTPLNEAPLQDRRYEDRRLDPQTSYTYVIRTVSRVAGEVVESVPSNGVTAALQPPEAGQGHER